jgi:hypothetical protein
MDCKRSRRVPSRCQRWRDGDLRPVRPARHAKPPCNRSALLSQSLLPPANLPWAEPVPPAHAAVVAFTRPNMSSPSLSCPLCSRDSWPLARLRSPSGAVGTSWALLVQPHALLRMHPRSLTVRTRSHSMRASRVCRCVYRAASRYHCGAPLHRLSEEWSTLQWVFHGVYYMYYKRVR